MRFSITLAVCALCLAGCEQLGLETPAQVAAAKQAEGQAIGGACRHSGRALEDCYTLNPTAVKSAVFNGWRDMDAYMRENSLEVVPSVVPKPPPPEPKKKTAKKKTPSGEEGATETQGEGAGQKTPAKPDAGHSDAAPQLPSPVAGGKLV